MCYLCKCEEYTPTEPECFTIQFNPRLVELPWRTMWLSSFKLSSDFGIFWWQSDYNFPTIRIIYQIQLILSSNRWFTDKIINHATTFLSYFTRTKKIFLYDSELRRLYRIVASEWFIVIQWSIHCSSTILALFTILLVLYNVTYVRIIRWSWSIIFLMLCIAPQGFIIIPCVSYMQSTFNASNACEIVNAFASNKNRS